MRLVPLLLAAGVAAQSSSSLSAQSSSLSASSSSLSVQSSSLSLTTITTSITTSIRSNGVLTPVPTVVSTVIRLSSLPPTSSSSLAPSSTTPSASSSASPSPPPIVLVRRSVLHPYLASFCPAGHSSRPCLRCPRCYSHPDRSSLRLLGPQK